jgi:pyruvate dehydrogenase E2 component (dihydrolipoamide acetyltransferase)
MTTGIELIEVRVPDIGDFDEVPIIEILVAAGDTVAAEDPLVTLESDKATMDVPAPAAGTVRELRVSVGDRVTEGSPLLMLEPEGEHDAAQAAPATSADAPGPQERAESALAQAADQEILQPEEAEAHEPAAEESRREEAEPAPRVSGAGTEAIYASPSVRRLARELGVSLAGVRGSGRKGRILTEDVAALADARAVGGSAGAEPPGWLGLAPWPIVDFEKFGPVERVKRSRIQRISAPALHRNWVMIPHVTHDDEADITELEAWRKRLNAGSGDVKFTMVSFLVAACVATLKAFPEFNASLDGDELVLRRYYNIGFAADTPGGLVVPVIKEADRKGLRAIAVELAELSQKARAGKLTPGDMSGGTFTISSLGGIGGTSFTPIINAPEVAILGVTRAAMKPVWDGAEFRPRLMVPLSLSYDHRVIDGAAAARFVVHLAEVLSDLKRALL